MRLVQRFYRYIVPFWRVETLALLLSAVTAVSGLIVPYFARLVIDKAYPTKDLGLFIILVTAMGIAFIAGSLAQGLSHYLVRYVKLRVSLKLSKSLFGNFQNLSYPALQENSTGEILYKIHHDIEQVTQLMADLIPQIFILIPRSFFLLGLILYMNPKMFLFVLALVPLTYLGPYYFTKILKRTWKTVIESSQSLYEKLQEIFSHMYLIKAYGKERRETRSYIKSVVHNSRLRLKNEQLVMTASFLNTLTQKVVMGVIIFYGGYQVIKGNMTLGSLSALSIYLGQLSGILGTFSSFAQQLSSGLVSCERLDKALDIRTDRAGYVSAKETAFCDGKIEFQDISFTYNTNHELLRKLSFTIEKGSCIALTGPSGSGKTTLINLLLRLYKPLTGQISLDGINIQDIEARSFYNQVGMVFQEPYLWNDTLENNIRYGKEDACFEEIEEAAKIACIDEFIQNLPEKYATLIGENACKISEGQKQRVAIARAVIKKPKILILDEAFSSLDSQLEEKIMARLKKALPESTLILISHRLSSLEKTDRIYFLETGNKLDQGPHDEIFCRNLKYRNYLAAQVTRSE